MIKQSDKVSLLLTKDSLKIRVMDVNTFIKSNHISEITSPSIFAPNSKEFHPEGLFSETIFGPIASPERLTTLGYIDLHTDLIHPEIFDILIYKKRFYQEVIFGRSYAVFDTKLNDFVAASQEDKNAGTGFSFFLKHLEDLCKSKVTSLRKKPAVEVLEKYKDNLTISKCIVSPAGLRDIRLDSSRLSQDDVNKIYLGLLNMAEGIKNYTVSDDPIFDTIRAGMQKKLNAIHTYIMDLLKGKQGFMNKHFGDRKVVFGTRNVLSADIIKSDHPDDPRVLRYDETRMPLLEAIKAYQPFAINALLRYCFNQVVSDSTTVKVMNSKFETVYVDITPKQFKQYSTGKGMTKLINEFKNIHFRESPITVKGKDGKDYYVMICHDNGNEIVMDVNLASLKVTVEKNGILFDKKMVRPVTYVEFMYIAMEIVCRGKHNLNARYPVIEDGSVFPAKIHLASTIEDRDVRVIFGTVDTRFPHYPILGKKYLDSLVVHTSRLPGMDGDHDGDTGSGTGVWTKESNENITSYLKSPKAYIGDNMKLKLRGSSDDIVAITAFNLSM